MIWSGVAHSAGPPWRPSGTPPGPVAAPGRLDPTGVPGPTAGPSPGLPRSPPVAIDIPRAGVQATVRAVGLTAGGAIDVPPPVPGEGAFWYRYLAAPGQVGPAVIVGHVDTARDGPAVFYRLGDLRSGDRVSVRRADGAVTTFVVNAVARYPKDRFPTSLVYGSTAQPQLRLITCGGDFDASRGSYRDNVVVFATLAS